ncbi:hypothetical protein T265_14528, partial [Opisthorchis viverrini]
CLRHLKVVRWPKWLERGFTDRKVRGSNPTFASRLPLSRLGQPDSIPTLVQPSGGMAGGEFTDRKVRGSNPTSDSRHPRLGLGNLAVFQPSCSLRIAWQLGTGYYS